MLLVIALFAGAAFLFAGTVDIRLPFTPSGPQVSPIPHPIDAVDADCSRCHTIEEESLPVTHRNYAQSTCRSCHRLSPPVLVTHDVELGETGCPLCHGDPDRSLGMPRDHLDYPEKQCLFCHRMDDAFADRSPRPAGVWRAPAPEVTHDIDGIFEDCVSCHQVDGTPPMPVNHEQFEPETCMWCHEQGDVPETDEAEATGSD